MSAISKSKEINDVGELMSIFTADIEDSPERPKRLLQRLVSYSEQDNLNDTKIYTFMKAAVGLAKADYLDLRDVIEQVFVPLSYSIESVSLLRNMAGCIASAVLQSDDEGHALGTSPYDRITFRALAVMFKTMSQTQDSTEAKLSFPREANFLANSLYGALSLNDANDREILSIIAPFTTQGAAAAAHRSAAESALRYLN